MERYSANATAEDRLRWYADHDIVGGMILAEVLNQLEENFYWDLTWDTSDMI